MKDVLYIRHLIRATGNTLCGIKDVLRSSCSFRQEVAFGLAQFVMLAIVQECIWVKMGLVSLWVLLLAAELINSAVESVVDLVSPDWNEYAKHAKDYCSAAVSLIVLLLAANWILVIVRQFGLL